MSRQCATDDQRSRRGEERLHPCLNGQGYSFEHADLPADHVAVTIVPGGIRVYGQRADTLDAVGGGHGQGQRNRVAASGGQRQRESYRLVEGGRCVEADAEGSAVCHTLIANDVTKGSASADYGDVRISAAQRALHRNGVGPVIAQGHGDHHRRVRFRPSIRNPIHGIALDEQLWLGRG